MKFARHVLARNLFLRTFLQNVQKLCKKIVRIVLIMANRNPHEISYFSPRNGPRILLGSQENFLIQPLAYEIHSSFRIFIRAFHIEGEKSYYGHFTLCPSICLVHDYAERVNR